VNFSEKRPITFPAYDLGKISQRHLKEEVNIYEKWCLINFLYDFFIKKYKVESLKKICVMWEDRVNSLLILLDLEAAPAQIGAP